MTNAAWRLHVYETLGSTSDLCRSLAATGEPDGLAVMARRQTAGRGSRGRTWLSDAGNLSLSLLLRPGGRARDAGHWALLAGVAVAESLDRSGVALKWPNDILFEGAKCGGVLVETATDAEGRLDWLVIGIGVNLASAPDLDDRKITSLRGIAADDLAAQIMARVDHWRCIQDWPSIRAAWLSHALPAGSRMTLRRETGDVCGSFAGLADDGSLLLQTAGRVHAFSSGEIWLDSPTC